MTDNECLKIIENRRTIRKFKNETIGKKETDILLDAAHMAPSAGNLQARDFIIITNEDTRKKLIKTLTTKRNITIENVPYLFIVCATPNRATTRFGERGEFYAIQDATASVMNVLLAAHSIGLGSCWMGAFKEEEVSKILNIPSSSRPIAMITIGYPDESPETPKRLKDMIVHLEAW
ncbi:MAG: nitroreductase family protein [Methanosarcinaceae archaeon]|nr:nitroreductase family protein [Methanosarcinaceae archaeon]